MSCRGFVVAGIDGSAASLHAAHWAAREADRARVPLRLTHALDVPALAADGAEGFFDALETDGRRRLVEVQDVLRAAYPRLEIDAALLTAGATPTLIDQSRTARLIVLGSTGIGGFTGVLAGSTAIALVAHGHCPVAVIRGRKPGEPAPAAGPVVVGVDGTPASEPAIATAFDEASWRGAELVAVHTWTQFSSDTSYSYARQYLIGIDEIEAEEGELLAERLAGWQEKYPDVKVRRIVTRNRPVRCLLEQAEHARLLVVGNRGSGGFSDMLHGSTSQALIYHAPCPLLVVRPHPDEMSTG